MIKRFVWVVALTLFGAACGDDGGVGTDSGTDAATGDGGTDGQAGDAGADGQVGDDGGEGDASPDGSTGDDGGLVDGGEGVPVTGVVRSDAPIAGATVSLLTADGTILDQDVTDATGAYEVHGPPTTVQFIKVDPLTDYLGLFRAQVIGPEGENASPLGLLPRAQHVTTVGQAGVTYDATKGQIVIGWNPVSRQDGGEGATISAAHDNAFNTIQDDVIVTNTLLPICQGGEDAGTCAPNTRSNQIFFPNVTLGAQVTVTLIQPGGGTCEIRGDINPWQVFADTMTSIDADCTAD